MISINRDMIEIVQYLGVFAIASFRIVPAAIRIFAAMQQIKYRQPTVNLLSEELNLSDLSMGMSSDYEQAVLNGSTYLRLGTTIFGERSN